jgi:hypothetical protein
MTKNKEIRLKTYTQPITSVSVVCSGTHPHTARIRGCPDSKRKDSIGTIVYNEEPVRRNGSTGKGQGNYFVNVSSVVCVGVWPIV